MSALLYNSMIFIAFCLLINEDSSTVIDIQLLVDLTSFFTSPPDIRSCDISIVDYRTYKYSRMIHHF